ncbi:MAG: (2Fe-2S)-binding protein [Planctomycetaceae bacterium]|jgi:xanthine dehydrogenase YagT iron-sulfur-binding subunit|nr:(2Fe-2S)-binding protein [Planctomycetaceae bacterium]
MRDRDDQDRSGPGFSRRDFLRGSAAAATATAMATQGTEETAAANVKANVFAAAAQNVTLNVNGKDHTVKVEPRVTLLHVLRNDLNLTGCKEVDERSADGADTVMIDGKAVLAGSRLAIECEGKKILTVESLRSGEKVDEVISGFVKHDAMQCGFCTPGFVVATRVFLNKNPKASLAEIRKGLGGNICRCGTYQGITQCALELAKGGK